MLNNRKINIMIRLVNYFRQRMKNVKTVSKLIISFVLISGIESRTPKVNESFPTQTTTKGK